MTGIILIGVFAFVLVLLEEYMYARFWNRGLSVSLGFNKASIVCGEEGELFEIIENSKFMPLSILRVKFETDRGLKFEDNIGSSTTDKFYRNDVFSIGMNERVTRTLPFTAAKRGVYSVENLDLIASDIFLSRQYFDTRKTDTTLYVYPKSLKSDEFRQSLKRLNGEILTKRHIIEDPFEFRGIREYQSFDSQKKINWKASAKTGELKVIQNNYTSLKAIRIFVDISDSGVLKKEDSQEACLEACAGLSEFFLSEGMQVSVFCNARDIFTYERLAIPASGGMGQMNTVLMALSRLSLADYTDFANLMEQILNEDTDSFTIFLSLNGYGEFTDILSEYKEKGMDFFWYYITGERTEPEIMPSLKENLSFIHFKDITGNA